MNEDEYLKRIKEKLATMSSILSSMKEGEKVRIEGEPNAYVTKQDGKLCVVTCAPEPSDGTIEVGIAENTNMVSYGLPCIAISCRGKDNG